MECNTIVTQELPNECCLDHLVMADHQFHKKAEFMLANGADIYPYIIRSGLFNPHNETAVAQNTAFGWTSILSILLNLLNLLCQLL